MTVKTEIRKIRNAETSKKEDRKEVRTAKNEGKSKKKKKNEK
jgi:hypothetical protein